MSEQKPTPKIEPVALTDGELASLRQPVLNLHSEVARAGQTLSKVNAEDVAHRNTLYVLQGRVRSEYGQTLLTAAIVGGIAWLLGYLFIGRRA